MDPGLDKLPIDIQIHLDKITMVEEMLISPILAVMSIFRLPGGALISKGYVGNFSQNISSLCTKLPRKTKDLPLLIIKKTGQNNDSIKEFKVNRNRIETLIKFFFQFNPLWKKLGIKINDDNLKNIPINGVPSDLNEMHDSNTSIDTIDQIITDQGPEIADNVIEGEEEEPTNAYIESDGNDILQIDNKIIYK